MSEADSILFGRAELERAFTALGERLVRRGVVADIFIVGGAAMALAYDAARVTRDVDAMFKPHGIVHEEAMQVANDLGPPADGSMSRQAPTSPARTTLTSAAYSIIPGCASWPPHHVTSSR
jgi:hypothetical protein